MESNSYYSVILAEPANVVLPMIDTDVFKTNIKVLKSQLKMGIVNRIVKILNYFFVFAFFMTYKKVYIKSVVPFWRIAMINTMLYFFIYYIERRFPRLCSCDQNVTSINKINAKITTLVFL